MRIVYNYPPIYQKVVKAFPAARSEGVIFTYGDTIFNPSKCSIPPAILAHEEVHSRRQGKTAGLIEEWWDQYLVDKQFRFDEELIAHKEEYNWYIKSSLREKRIALNFIAKRLSSPVYGNLTTLKRAKRILEPVK